MRLRQFSFDARAEVMQIDFQFYWENSPRRPAHYGVRTQTAKLIYYDGLVTESEARKWEFYDLLTDPTETTNQYDQVEGDVSIKALVDELFSWRKKLEDR